MEAHAFNFITSNIITHATMQFEIILFCALSLAVKALPTPGSMTVFSSSPLAPTGVTVVSERLAIEGAVSVGGQLPFAASLPFDAAMAGSGRGNVEYGCGDQIAITRT